MLEGYGPVTQALLGTLFTWGLTAAGAGLVFFIRGTKRKLLDASLGFAAGVMTAASYWSLLAPAIEESKRSGIYGKDGEWAFVPVAVGFLTGAVFVYGTDVFLDYLGINSPNMMIAMTKSNNKSKNKVDEDLEHVGGSRGSYPMSTVTIDTPGCDNMEVDTEISDCISNQHGSSRRRTGQSQRHSVQTYDGPTAGSGTSMAQRALEQRQSQWKRIMLLVVAITVHNIPEGLAVGVAFGAAAASDVTSFDSASIHSRLALLCAAVKDCHFDRF